ncbi:MAG: hypothetical protein ACTHO8_13805 [Solirubrobacterales bacterium]
MGRKADTEDKPKGAGDERATTAAEDDRDQLAVLHEVLVIYPEQMTLDELVRAMTLNASGFSERDGIERAVRELIAGGLLHRVGELVLPTRAAVNFYALQAS